LSSAWVKEWAVQSARICGKRHKKKIQQGEVSEAVRDWKTFQANRAAAISSAADQDAAAAAVESISDKVREKQSD
jgi:hypothetical protein